MESVIKWETGMPTEIGRYIITKKSGKVLTINFNPKEELDLEYFERFVVAWYPLSDIEPYKEE
jgi:hypothetical protein